MTSSDSVIISPQCYPNRDRHERVKETVRAASFSIRVQAVWRRWESSPHPPTYSAPWKTLRS